jgi:hypothetical protein
MQKMVTVKPFQSRVGADTVRYSSLYVAPQRGQHKANIPQAKAAIPTPGALAAHL